MRLFAALLSLALAAFAAAPAHAQCTSNASSCVTCHETQALRPVLSSAQPWHADHGFGDLCAACHGGAPGAPAKDDAHAAMRRDPLADGDATACASCHEDGAARAAGYRAARPPPTSAPAPPPPAPPATPPRSSRVANVGFAIASLALGIGLHAALARSRRAPRRSLRAWVREKTWSPYAAGALLGVAVAFSEVVCGRPIAVSGAFDKLAAYVGRALFPSSQYYGHVMTPGITWQVWLVLGALAGSFASSRLAGEARVRWLPDTQWQPRFGTSRAVRFAIAFAGAVVVQFAAGIAGGCTSGLAISGGAALAPGAFLFMAGMFAGGIPAAWLWYRGRKD